MSKMNTDMPVAVTDALITKLRSISMDIKVYVNTNYHLATTQEGVHPLMDPDDVAELVRIRDSIKNITRRAEEKNSFSTRAKNKLHGRNGS